MAQELRGSQLEVELLTLTLTLNLTALFLTLALLVEVELTANTREIGGIQHASELSGRATLCLVLVVSGLTAFATLDRLTGQWSTLESEWASGLKGMVQDAPLLWFLFNLGLWGWLASRIFQYTQGGTQAVSLLPGCEAPIPR